jgi:hypothetical protein
MKRFRIYTEYKPNLVQIVMGNFKIKNFSLSPTLGVFNGQAEESCIIEILAGEHYSPLIRDLAEYIKQTNNQKEVLVTEEPITTLYRTGRKK